MTEITRVPIKPVGAGSLVKLWLGVIVAVLLGGGLAWAALPKSFSIETITAGEGASPQPGDVAFVKYTGTLADTGEEFDKWRPEPWPIPGIFPEGTGFRVEQGATVDGFYEALQQMQKGGTYKVYIPAEMGYGAEPPPGSSIPPNADLIFEMELVDFFTEEQIEQKFAIMQRAMEAQGPPPGVPGGPGGPGAVPPSGPPQGAPPPVQQPVPGN